MKGISILDPENYPGVPDDWGKDLAINNTGIYCFLLVNRVVQDSIVIFSSSLRELAPAVPTPATVQLVRVPYYESARLTGDIRAAPWDPATGTGRFQLAPSSPGAGAGEPLPNFSHGYSGRAPDVGAHQRGAPPMRFGVGAGRPQQRGTH